MQIVVFGYTLCWCIKHHSNPPVSVCQSSGADAAQALASCSLTTSDNVLRVRGVPEQGIARQSGVGVGSGTTLWSSNIPTHLRMGLIIG
jgi:hypothetical protein